MTRLTYNYRVLGGDTPKSGTNASLFIDWWYGPGWVPTGAALLLARPVWRPALPPALVIRA